MFLVAGDERADRTPLKPMNCPGHMLLFGQPAAELSRPAAPLRGVVDAAPQRARRHAARAAAGAAHHPGRRAHLLHARADRGRDLRLPRLRRPTSTTCSGSSARVRALDPAREQARHRRGVGLHRGRAAGGARAARHRVRPERGRRRVLRAEDRPAHDRRRSGARGRWGRSSSTRRCRRGSVSPTWAPTTPSTRRTSSIGRCSARSSGSSGILIEHYGGALPVLARAGAGAADPGRRGASRGGARARATGWRGRLPGRRRRARRDARQADPRRRAGEDPVRGRLRRPRVRRVARRARARRRAVDAVARRAPCGISGAVATI